MDNIKDAVNELLDEADECLPKIIIINDHGMTKKLEKYIDLLPEIPEPFSINKKEKINSKKSAFCCCFADDDEEPKKHKYKRK